jgi:hypothetical protein
MENTILSILEKYIKKFDGNYEIIYKIVNYCKNYYENSLLEKNLCPDFLRFKKKACEYIDFFVRIRNRVICREKIRNIQMENNIINACNELQNFIKCIKHYEDDFVKTESENIDANLNFEDDENNDKYENSPFLEVTIKKIYFETGKAIQNFEIKYVKFDYDSQVKIPDIILEKNESIYFNNKIIFFDDGAYTNYAKYIYDILQFKNLSFLEFSSFLSYLFDTDYEVDPKLYSESSEIDFYYSSDSNSDSNSDYSKDENFNCCEEYNQNDNFDCIYDVIHDFNMLIQIENQNDRNNFVEYLISILDKYLKQNLFPITNYISKNNLVDYNEKTLLLPKSQSLTNIISDENFDDFCYFVNKITNVKYDIHNSKIFEDDICKIISFHIFYDDVINLKYVLFKGILNESSDYHLQSIENIYANNKLIIYNKKETTDYAWEIYKKFNFNSVAFDNFISFIYLLFKN